MTRSLMTPERLTFCPPGPIEWFSPEDRPREISVPSSSRRARFPGVGKKPPGKDGTSNLILGDGSQSSAVNTLCANSLNRSRPGVASSLQRPSRNIESL